MSQKSISDISIYIDLVHILTSFIYIYIKTLDDVIILPRSIFRVSNVSANLIDSNCRWSTGECSNINLILRAGSVDPWISDLWRLQLVIRVGCIFRCRVFLVRTWIILPRISRGRSASRVHGRKSLDFSPLNINLFSSHLVQYKDSEIKRLTGYSSWFTQWTSAIRDGCELLVIFEMLLVLGITEIWLVWWYNVWIDAAGAPCRAM